MESRTSTVSRKNVKVINFAQSRTQSRDSIVFHATSQNFKIQAIPKVLIPGKSYEHDFAKKRDSHKHSSKSHAKSSFNRFFVNFLEISKY
ncbi:hypothetical protein BHE74_00055264 [Ensete ventricosum]|nr:hypothetical protein GW17_00061457 [Ensete ventricosum]RWW39408.1 hypothetical protein BHE74_00055264 [Ensete ventricosum]RZS23735.1 hypothetical protein BHM03_00056715 [Ensete ventricosum]